MAAKIEYPSWVLDIVAPGAVLSDDDQIMRVAIQISLASPRESSGGPFGAVVASDHGEVIALGYNQVVPNHDFSAHAEIMALRRAQKVYSTHSLRSEGVPKMRLFASCAPCIMCIGAIHWAGIPDVLAGARTEDAEAIGFCEGASSIDIPDFLASRNIQYRGDVLRDEAAAALRAYQGQIYNG